MNTKNMTNKELERKLNDFYVLGQGSPWDKGDIEEIVAILNEFAFNRYGQYDSYDKTFRSSGNVVSNNVNPAFRFAIDILTPEFNNTKFGNINLRSADEVRMVAVEWYKKYNKD